MTQVGVGKRVKGFVVGHDTKAGELIWRVRVGDLGSDYDGNKFQVHSLHPGTMLTKSGTNVNFYVDFVQVGHDQTLMAFDVMEGHEFPRNESEAPTSINIVITVMDGEYHLAQVGLKTLAEARQEYQNTDEQVVDLLTFTSDHSHYDVLHALLYGDDDFRDVVEEFLLQVFLLGQKHHTN